MVTMSRGKFAGINACANSNGVIAAAAMDQRGSLRKAIAKARGEGGTATPEDLAAFWRRYGRRFAIEHAFRFLRNDTGAVDGVRGDEPHGPRTIAWTGQDRSVRPNVRQCRGARAKRAGGCRARGTT